MFSVLSLAHVSNVEALDHCSWCNVHVETCLIRITCTLNAYRSAAGPSNAAAAAVAVANDDVVAVDNVASVVY